MTSGYLLLLLLLLGAPLVSLGVHFELGLPDLIATKRSKDGDVTIKGYRAVTNEALLATNRSDIASQLLWATVGDPRIIKSEAPTIGGLNASKKVFHFTDTGFYMMMQLKTQEDSELLAKRAALKYGLPIAPSQVRHLLLSKLTCVLDLRDTDRRSVRIGGAPARLDRFPLKVEFNSPLGSESRSLFEKRLLDDPDMSVPCSICLSSLSEDAGPGEIAGSANVTNVTESSVLPVPPDSGSGVSDCRRWQPPSRETLARELTSVATNLSGLACDIARLEDGGGGGSSLALTAALNRARAACDRLPSSSSSPAALLANLTTLLDRLRGLPSTDLLRHRLALRVVYSLAGGRTHNLLDSRRLRARPAPTDAAARLLGPDGAIFAMGSNAALVAEDDASGDMSDLMDELDTDWTFFVKLKLTESAGLRPLLTFWNPRSRRLVQLSVGASRFASVLASGRRAVNFGDLAAVAGFSAPAALKLGDWHRVAVVSPAGGLVLDGTPLTIGIEHAASAVVSASPTAALPTDRLRFWLGAAPGGSGGGGGFGGVVGCIGAAAAALTPAEIEAAMATYCN